MVGRAAPRALPPAGGRAYTENQSQPQAMQTLADLSPGSRATLERVGGERSFRRRLMEMGFLPGTPVRVVRRVAIGRLVELELRGCHLSLRLSEAEQIFVAAAPER